MACSKSAKNKVDYFSNAPDIVIDKILESMPIRMAARTSVLSKQWRHAWLSLEKLNFDAGFWAVTKDNSNVDWRKGSQIISGILLCHSGPVHEFDLNLPCEACMTYRHWISFLSKNGVRKIVIRNCYLKMAITTPIFWCSELVHLELSAFNLNPPPTDFIGFPNLKHLVLAEVKFITQSSFSSLIGNCRMLETLKLVNWSGMDHIVIDAPSLQTLVLNGDFQSLAFGNLRSLKSISVCLKTMPKNHTTTVATIDAVNLLASSCQLRYIKFDGHLCKLFAAGGNIRSSSVTFNNLHGLCLSNLDLSNFDAFRYLLSMVECCPYIKKLDISVISSQNVGQNIVDFNYNYKLDHLREVIISGITGSSAELKLVEYLLAISTVLENLFLKCGKLGIDSKLKMSSALMGFPRASPKARLLFLEK
ncbi:F-box/FBD/LRR-repeat protein At1g13570-like [Silene latifolia]|uniref:F-box/FBD/LRR-repeat protein At1g13570-like n=1 Tax=Silene latifolia TaxID=37657 RepID=UPI003D770A91